MKRSSLPDPGKQVLVPRQVLAEVARMTGQAIRSNPPVSLARGTLSSTPALDAAAVAKDLAPHQDLFLQGDTAHQIYIVASGRVKLWRTLDDGSACTLLILGRGEALGCVAVAQDAPQLTSATAMEPVRVIAWNAELFRKELHHSADLANSLLRAVSRRAHQLLDRFNDITGLPVEQRLARILLRLAGEFGQHSGPWSSKVDIRQQDLAEMAMTTVPTVSRCLSRWEREGIVVAGRGAVKIEQIGRLAEIAGIHLD